MKAKVTVCILHVSRDELLRKCLGALYRNTHIPFEVLVVNEGEPIPDYLEDLPHLTVIEAPSGIKIRDKKRLFLDCVKTPFFTKLDNDMMTFPKAIDYEVETINGDPRLGAVSGLMIFNGEIIPLTGIANLKVFFGRLIKWRIPTEKLLSLKKPLYVDHLPEGLTTFRTEMFEDVEYNESYDVGYDHWDLFCQIKESGWLCALDSRAFFDHRHQESSDEYLKFHSEDRLKLIQKSREYFISKWGLYPIDVNSKSLIDTSFYITIEMIERLRTGQPLFHGVRSYLKRRKTGTMELKK